MKTLWLIFHHCIAHPLMVFLPSAWGNALHDWTAAKAFGAEQVSSPDGGSK